MLFLINAMAFAQGRVITGTVTSMEDGTGVPNATVLVKGSTVGTATNVNGKYSITVVGISNGQCRISAFDKGNDEKFPTAAEIKQMIKGITPKTTVNANAAKPTPTPKPGVKNTTYKPPKG